MFKGDPVRLKKNAWLAEGRFGPLRGVILLIEPDPNIAVVDFEGWMGEQRVFIHDLEPDPSNEPRKTLTFNQRRQVKEFAQALEKGLKLSKETGSVQTVRVDEILSKMEKLS